MSFLIKIDNILARIEGWLIILFLSLMVAFTFMQVCLRALFTHGHLHWANMLMGQTDWSEPLVRLLVLWVTFLGASLVTRENRHIRIDLLGSFLPEKWLHLRELILSGACLLICGIMVKVSIEYIKVEREFSGTMFSSIPTWVGELIIPAGFLLIFFHFMVRVLYRMGEIFPGSKG